LETTIPTALIIVDVQRSLVEDETWEPDRILDRVCELEATARAAGAPIFYVTDSRVEPHAELHARLSPQASDRLISKANCDSFLATTLQADLDALSVTRLVVSGLQTDFCIDTTCRRAASLGYQVTLVADAHSTFDRDYISAEKVIEHHNRILASFPAGAGRVAVVPTDQVEFR
jgi:nicotinamidase-related amidase